VSTAEARVYSVMAKVAALQGDARSEIRYQIETVAALRRAQDTRGQATGLAQLGEAYLRQGDRTRALDYLRQGLSSSKETNDPVAEGVALTGLMRYWRASRQTDAAVFFGKQAVAQFQQTRSNLLRLDPSVQRAYVDSRAQVYRELADLLIAQGRLPEAQQILDLIKEQEFLDFVRRDVAETSDDKRSADFTAAEAASLERYQAIADRIVEIGARHRELLAIENRTPEEQRALGALETDLTAANVAFSKALAAIVAEFGRSTAGRAQVTSIKEDQSLMADLHAIGPGTVIAYTLLTPTQYHVLLMTSDVRKAVTVNIDPAELNRRIFAMREALQAPTRDPRGPARAVYDIVMAPIAHDLEQAHAKTILWSLDRALRYVPMAALYDGHRYVAESYQNAVITPASRSHIADSSQAVHWTGLGVGVSHEVSGFAGLPAVAAELHSIFRESPQSPLGVLSGHVLLDDAFTADAFRASLREHAPVVHIASHFQLRPGHDQDSFLLLGDGTHMTLADFRNAPNVFENVDLLTLSACNTAVGTDADGDEIESFGVIAQRQGAKTVVASLWPVVDESTRTLMEQFYRTRVDSGLPKAEALRQAQLALLHGSAVGSGSATPLAQHPETALPPRGVQLPGNTTSLPLFAAPAGAPWSHPYYWAPFILIGNAR
jgi:CHAT domain-containing protein